MNLVFNGVMWALFTRALTLSSSTVRTSIINTSANFVMTALLGLGVFNEDLPPLWWLGAGMLVLGSVVIGRRDENAGKHDELSEATSGASNDEVKGLEGSGTSGSGAGSGNTKKRKKK